MTASSIQDVAPGSRVLIRGEEWLVKRIDTNTLGNKALLCEGISPLVHGREAVFLGAEPFGEAHRQAWTALGDQILAL